MNPREKFMLEALRQVANSPDCARFCSLIARKKLQEYQRMVDDEIVRTNEQAFEVFEKTLNSRRPADRG
jgi:hypothetical protein